MYPDCSKVSVEENLNLSLKTFTVLLHKTTESSFLHVERKRIFRHSACTLCFYCSLL